ncbi:MAG TPA: ACP S-malonyltransferase [Candidatus Udaeobacter sp.]|jgi:[acyl-carrier-protein] S-malonyltransferase|nr:ACP S-malonyltransferase [Candidatus Udaeobacter sp.]
MLASEPARASNFGWVAHAHFWGARAASLCSPKQNALALGNEASYLNAMPKKIALLFAGQGAQTVGMGRDLAEQFPTAANLFQKADDVLKRDLSEIAWNGPIEDLTKTSNCQPALFVHGLACLSVLRELAGNFPIGGAAGLSLGEMTAHAAAGTFDFANGLQLVQRRGELMDEACEKTFGGMAALIGAEENIVRQLAADEDVDVANINAPGQIVISGELAKVEAAVGVAKEYGVRRATMLNVAGAYHSRLMESAYEKLGAVLQHVPMQPPSFPVISNVTGDEVRTPVEIRRTLQDQVTGTVRWLDCMERLAALGCDFFVELGPGGVLAGLVRRTLKGVDVMPVADVESVRKAAERLL